MPTAERLVSVQEVMERYWQAKSSPEVMWDSWQAPQRHQILMALACLPAFESLYELGCGSGPNLRAIAQHRPKVRLGGCDVNATLANWASDHLGVPIDLAHFPVSVGPEWDVALTCFSLVYIPLDEVRETLHYCQTKHLVLVEPCAYVAPFARPGVYGERNPHNDIEVMIPFHVHPYFSLLKETGWTVTWRWPIFPDYQGLNTVLIAER